MLMLTAVVFIVTVTMDRVEEAPKVRDRVLSRGNSHIRGSGHSLAGNKAARGSFIMAKGRWVQMCARV